MLHSNKGVYLTQEEFTPALQARFTIKNLEKIEAKRMQRWGWQKLPDTISLFKKEGNIVRVPMGVLGYMPHTDTYISDTVCFPSLSLTPYDDQRQAVDELTTKRSGLLHASTGTGKTLMACMIAKKLSKRTLIIVKDLTLLGQMVREIQKIFGLNPMYYGGTITKKHKSTISTDIIAVANIESRDKVENLESYHCVIVDECHVIIQSKVRRDWVCSLSPQYLYGLTGTPKLNGVDDEAFRIIFGKVTSLVRKNFTPMYTRVITDYIGYLDDDGGFADFETQLYSDEERNQMIVNTVMQTLDGRKGIVFCKRVEHVENLALKLRGLGIYTEVMIGNTKADERERIRKAIIEHNGPCLIIGNVKIIGTGFDCPPLSVGYLTTAEKFDGNITQYMGRIIRDFPGKTDCKFYDFVDSSTGILANQAKTRLRNAKKEYPNLVVKTILAYK